MATRLLSIAADLSAPPSSPSCFRDLTLIASIRGFETVAIAPADLIDPFARWFRLYGLWDYLADLLPETTVVDASVVIVGGTEARLTAHNLPMVLGYLR